MEEAHVRAHLRHDAVLAAYLENADPLLWPPHFDMYETLLRSIVFQQLNGKAAETIHNRFLALFPDKNPEPEEILRLDTTQLRQAGLSGQKSQYIRNVAAFALENNRLNADWDAMSDEEILRFLTQIKGVGPWTVEMMLIFTLRRPDVFPVDDFGIQQSMKKWYGIDYEGKALKEKMREIAEKWRPFRSYAVRYLWNMI